MQAPLGPLPPGPAQYDTAELGPVSALWRPPAPTLSLPVVQADPVPPSPPLQRMTGPLPAPAPVPVAGPAAAATPGLPGRPGRPATPSAESQYVAPRPGTVQRWEAPRAPGQADHPGFTEVRVQRADGEPPDVDRTGPGTEAPGAGAAPAPAGAQTVSGADAAIAAAAAGTATTAPGASQTAVAGQSLDELARRLYEPLSARLRAELWLDRERSGRTLVR